MSCLPEVHIQDVTKRLPKLIHPPDHYPFLLVHVGIKNTAKHDIEQIRGDYKALAGGLRSFENKWGSYQSSQWKARDQVGTNASWKKTCG